MGSLAIAPADDVAPLLKRAGFLIVPRLPGQLGHQVVGNIVAKLTNNGDFGRGWKFLFFHWPAMWQVSRKFPTTFSNSYGMAVKQDSPVRSTQRGLELVHHHNCIRRR